MSTPLSETAISLVTSDRAQSHLETYFSSFTGRLFEELLDPQHPNVVTAKDLVAVQALSVLVPVEAAHSLLTGALGVETSGLLEQIPDDVSLGEPAAEAHLTVGSPADEAWRLLTSQHGIKWVIAGKLLAAKRPGLLPVYDQVVKCRLGSPSGFWTTLNSAFQAPDLREALGSVRKSASLPPNVSDLRVFDVIVWMDHHEQHRHCPE